MLLIRIKTALLAVIAVLGFSTCEGAEHEPTAVPPTENKVEHTGKVELTYMGQATLRIVTETGKVIYVDPYSGDDYSKPADLILVTHEHFDHNAVGKVKNRVEGCRIIRSRDAIEDGKHKSFEFDYVRVQPVQAGFNRLHDPADCVGYVLTFNNGKKVFASGDTSTTDQMRDGSMAEMKIDYAFLCTDGYYNMGNEEAAKAAEMIKAVHTVPYHNSTANDGYNFSDEAAETFPAVNKLIVRPGETIIIE